MYELEFCDYLGMTSIRLQAENPAAVKVPLSMSIEMCIINALVTLYTILGE